MILGKRKFESSKAKEIRRRKRILKTSLILAVLAIVLGGLAYLSRLEAVVIGEISIEGNSITPTNSIEKIVEDGLAGAYFFVLPKNNSIFYPRRAIKEGILNEINRIREVELSVLDLKTLVVRVSEREPNATWCNQEGCYFMDPEGFVYSEAPEFSGDIFLKYYGDISGNPIGKRYLTEEYFESLSTFIEIVKDFGLEIVSISIDEFEDIEAGLKEGGEIIFNKTQDLNLLAGDINSIFSDESFKIEFESGAELDYIDLRFGNKVYFQFR